MKEMKLKNGLLLSEIAGKTVVLPVEGDIDLNTVITLNETGAFLWKLLQNETTEDELVAALLNEYDVDEALARKSVQTFVGKLQKNGLVD